MHPQTKAEMVLSFQRIGTKGWSRNELFSLIPAHGLTHHIDGNYTTNWQSYEFKVFVLQLIGQDVVC